MSVGTPVVPTGDDFLEDLLKGGGDVLLRVVFVHLSQVTVIADVVACPVLVHVGMDLRFARDGLCDLEGFQNGAGVPFAAAEVVDLPDTGCTEEAVDESGHIPGVYVVSDLLTLVSEYMILAAFEIALYQIAEETMEFDARMVRASQATST